MGSGTSFQPVLTDDSPTSAGSAELKKILLVSGKIYYDLSKEIASKNLQSQIVVVRLEELCPFPFSALASALRKITDSRGVDLKTLRVQWVQEEARNQGAYGHAAHRMPSLFDVMGWDGKRLEYVGRRPMEVPAVGAAVLHQRDKQRLMEEALAL